MKRRSKITSLLLFLVLTVFLASCASGPKFAEVSPKINKLPPDLGRIYVYRTCKMGLILQPKVYLNGEVIGRAVPGGFFYVDRKPGNYTIEVSTEVKRKLSFVLEPGQERYVRLDVSWGFFVGHVYPKLVEKEIGKKEIKKCRFVSYSQK